MCSRWLSTHPNSGNLNKIQNSFRGRPFDSEGGGGAWQILSSQNIYFRGFVGQKIYFQPLKGKIIYFLYTIMWNLEAKLFIFLFSRGIGQNIYFHCYPGQNIYLQNLPGPHLRIKWSSP